MSDIDLPSTIHAEQTRLRLPSLPPWIEPAVEFLCQKAILSGACHEGRSGKLLLVLQEALTNAVVHGNLGISSELKECDDDSFARTLAERAADPELTERVVEVTVDYDGQRCRWMITDQGPGFDVDRVLARLDSDDPELLLASGRGILIMRSFMDEVRYESGGRRVVLTLNRQSGEERRQAPRMGTNQPLRVAPIRADGSVDWEAAYQAVSLNLSQQGIGLLQKQLSTSARILIGIFTGDHPIYIPAQVRHCQTLGDNVVELGCRFEAGPEIAPATRAAERDNFLQQSVEALLKERDGPKAEDERRAHRRIVFNDRIEILRKSTATPVIAYARDLSKGGIAFIATQSLPAEDVTVVISRQPGSPLRLRSRITRCNKVQEGFYDVGASFLGVEG